MNIVVILSPQVLPFQAILRRFAQDDNLFVYRHCERSVATLPKVAAVALLLIRRLTLTRLKLTF